MTKNINGIQIIGTQRSGSNLLRVMLDQSNEITALHPPHILQNFVPLMIYFNTANETDYRELVTRLVDFIKCNPVPWSGITFDVESLINRARTRSIYELFRLIYEETALQRGTQYWCCKSMTNFKYVTQFEAEGIRPKYIYIYRDGRDVAVSFKKAVVGEKHVYHLAQQWRNDQNACIEVAKNLGKERCHVIKYEELISDPAYVMQGVCGFLSIGFSESMLDYHTSAESNITASSGKMWSNLTKPVLKGNHGKFHNELSASELAIFELVAGDVLSELGYSLYSSASKHNPLSPESLAQYHLQNEFLKKNLINSDCADVNSRNGQRYILDAVKSRNVNQYVL